MLRPARPDEWPAIADVIRPAFATYREFAGEGWTSPADMLGPELGERLAQPDAWGVVAERDGAPVAFAAFQQAREDRVGAPIEGLAHVWAVFAVPGEWGTGTARAVHDALLAEIAARGFPEARLWTPALQARARAFYERGGWTVTGEPAYVEALGLDVVEYRRPIP